jgi:hypothetical protein
MVAEPLWSTFFSQSVRAIGEGDQEAVIMLDCDDGRLVRAARSSADMADD